MSLNEPALIRKLNTKLGYLSERQTTLSKNIANIDTPDYRAKDIKKVDFDRLVGQESTRITMTATSGKHLSGTRGQSGGHFEEIKDKVAEARKPVGNNIVLEEQMGKVSDVGAEHQLTSSLLKKFHQLYRMAIDSRGAA